MNINNNILHFCSSCWFLYTEKSSILHAQRLKKWTLDQASNIVFSFDFTLPCNLSKYELVKLGFIFAQMVIKMY